jgi:hypothetical protein
MYGFNTDWFQLEYHSYNIGLVILLSMRSPLWQEHLHGDIL